MQAYVDFDLGLKLFQSNSHSTEQGTTRRGYEYDVEARYFLQ